MSDQDTVQPQAAPSSSWTSRLGLVLALVALLAAGGQWLGLTGNRELERTRSEELAKAQRRINALEDRMQREREDFNRLAARIGAEGQSEDTLTGRIARLEESLAKMPGGGRVRFLWLLEQAEYYLRIANAQESLAGDADSALTALSIADDHLRAAGDPRLAPLRKLIASEIAELRAVPRVDTEGLSLRLSALADSLNRLPRRQAVPSSFSPETAPIEAGSGRLDRAWQRLSSAFFSIVSVRRTDVPPTTLVTEESAAVMMRSLDLELQMARLALLRGEGAAFKTSLAAVRRGIEENFDVSSPQGAAALATVDELSHAPLSESRPDLSASVTELLKLKERESGT